MKNSDKRPFETNGFDLTKYKNSIQYINGGKDMLFDRYDWAEQFISKNIDLQYQDFLSQPQKTSDNKVIFKGKTIAETPRRLSELDGEEQIKYRKIRDETIAHYKSKIYDLRNIGKKNEADYLDQAIKWADSNEHEEYVYCYDDDKVVLGAWGMQLKDNHTQHNTDKEGIYETDGSGSKIKPKLSFAPQMPTQVMSADTNKSSVIPSDDTTKSLDDVTKPPETIFDDKLESPQININQKTEKRSVVRWSGFPRILKWLLWLLGLLLLLLLLVWLFSGYKCGGRNNTYAPNNPYRSPAATPPDYENLLPPQQGVLPRRDNPPIVREPGKPPVIGDELNILMENKDKSILDFAEDFAKKYPKPKYVTVYYDTIIKMMKIRIPPEERKNLREEIPKNFAPKYELFVYDEALFEAKYTPNDPAFKDQKKSWYLYAVNAPQAWAITRGTPKVIVAIIDNGFSLKHPELKNKVVKPYNVWSRSNKITARKVDHGTHVAGIALATADNKKGLLGIAPDCAFMPVQVADVNGLMTTTSTANGVLYAIYQGANVVNVSLGVSLSGLARLPENAQRELIRDSFKEEERLWNKIAEIANKYNSTIIVSAGNDNILAGITPYQRQRNIITVSAIDKKNHLASKKADFSNYGEYSDISAPGVDIYSSVGENGYKMMDGTSMAAPIVTGAVALMKSLRESITTEQVICILQTTGRETADNNIGKMIQIDNALQMVKMGDTSAWSACVNRQSDRLAVCDAEVDATGGIEGYVRTFDMGQKSGSFAFFYDTKNIPDSITIYDGTTTDGKAIFKYLGGTKGTRKAEINFNERFVTIKIVGTADSTGWAFRLSCPTNNTQQPAKDSVGNPGKQSTGDRKDGLRRERERLKRRMDEIDRELQDV